MIDELKEYVSTHKLEEKTMTREEAIRGLEYIKSSFKGTCSTDTLIPISRIEVEALNTAIESLENQKTLQDELEKIKAEIDTLYGVYLSCFKERLVIKTDVMQILDKHIGE